MKIYIVVTILLILGGCSSKYMVKFDSNPKGASLVCNGKNWGPTPIALYYDESVKKQSTVNVGNCSANWVSGARKSYPSNLNVYPKGSTVITVDRPSGNGYAQDASYSLQLRQTEAAEKAAAAKSYDSNSNSTVSCKKFFDTSYPLKIYQFNGQYCPPGYYK